MYRTAFLLALTTAAAHAERISIVVSNGADAVEHTAADELTAHLARTFPADRFALVATAPASGKAIFLGTAESSPEVASYVPKEKLTTAESFIVTSVQRNGMPAGIIAGAGSRGVLFGVYALLEKLGWGFYLSYEASPVPIRQPVDFAGWNLSDAPLFRDRVVFDWHNFLSSASTWELEDWKNWIRGAARMRYNTVMVHAYGNNPMFSFQYHGQAKPAGYLATTRQGRDWGTQHVNDVRRLIGGEVFHSPVFGSSVAQVPDAERAQAAQQLMRKVFTFARSYGMHVTFALDVDTESANPQNIIGTLPQTARFRSGEWQLVNPDTPEGFAYWKAQVEQLLETYPEIDRLVPWFRTGKTPWRDVKPEEFPAAWKELFEAGLRMNPALRQDRQAPAMFALSRVAAAFERALQELHRTDVELGAGTWYFAHLPAAHAFFPPKVKLYWLDYAIVFDQPKTQDFLRAIPRERPMLPIVWAHHDDRTFAGRPYTPFAKFTSLVEGAGTGFGVIHWTTRPLDLYFKSLAEQVWRNSRDRALSDTTRDMAARSFGAPAADLGGEYLLKWVTESRMFGRETGNRFIDVPLADSADVIAKCRERQALLSRIEETALPAEGRERLHYYRDFEEFVAQFFRTHAAFERAQDRLKRGEIQEARTAIADADPAGAIAQYAKAASHGGITRGEQALVVALNLKWLPYILSMRQALGLEPARYAFQATQHEPLAQGAGMNTFFVDDKRALWKVMGEKETGAPADTRCIRITSPLTLKLGAIMGDRLAPGRYRAELTIEGAADSSIVEMRGSPKAAPVIGKSVLVDVTTGAVEVTIRPLAGTVSACAFSLFSLAEQAAVPEAGNFPR